MKYLPLLIMGLLIIGVGISNLLGHISSIHRYNRSKVHEEDLPVYGKMMGIGTVVVGGTIALIGILQMVLDMEFIFYLAIPGLIVGVGVMLYAQFKYNRGIF